MKNQKVIASMGVGLALIAGLAFAAPAPKAVDEKLAPPTQEQFDKADNNLKQIAIAFHSYHDTVGKLPSNEAGKDKKPLLSWRVQILPYIEEIDLYNQFRMDEPWDSENNKKLIDKMPKLYEPIRVKRDKGLTFYQSFVGSNGVLTGKYTLANIPDGSSNTFLCVESGKPVIWTKPEDLEYDGKKIPALGGLFDGKFHGAMGDGSVVRVRKGANEKMLSNLIDPADGNVVDLESVLDKSDEKK